MRHSRSVLNLWLVLFTAIAMTAHAEPAPPADPSTYLCDTQDAPAAAGAAEWLSRFSARTRLDEDDKSHVFKHRTVFMNDKVLAVLDDTSANLSVYSRQTEGVKLCATLQPICEGQT